MIQPFSLRTFMMGVFGFICLWIFQQIIQTIVQRFKYRLPNPVPGVPVFGNSLQIPLSHQGPWAKTLAGKYGEMFTCSFGGQKWVFLNSSRVVYDLMERRAALYCSRPRFPMTQEIMSRNSRLVLMPYSERWRTIRKTMHNILSKRQQDIFKPYQDLESRHLCWDYLYNPGKWWVANGRFSNSVIMSVVFGRRVDLDDPELVDFFNTIDYFLSNQQPGVNIVDSFPVLARLPKFLQWWRPRGNRIYEETKRVYKRELDRVERKIADGTVRPCFALDFLKTKEAQIYGEDQKLFVLGTLLEAGSDTSRVSIGNVVAAAATYPDWVMRAREELDRVCGANAERLPGWEDRAKLPYVTAAVKESFRWRPNLTEIGVPTSLIKDDEYEGYKFPAGTIFTWNAWSIALDEKEYSQPETFLPERFLNSDLNNPLKGLWGFGPGRRVCVGWNVGESNVWISAARLIYCFDFIEDPNNRIDTFSIPIINKGKTPFAVTIKPRSDLHRSLIDRECTEATKTIY